MGKPPAAVLAVQRAHRQLRRRDVGIDSRVHVRRRRDRHASELVTAGENRAKDRKPDRETVRGPGMNVGRRVAGSLSWAACSCADRLGVSPWRVSARACSGASVPARGRRSPAWMPAKPRPDEATRRRPRQASWRLFKVSQLTREDDVRVSRAFSRPLRLDGIWVRRVQFFSDVQMRAGAGRVDTRRRRCDRVGQLANQSPIR